MKIKSVQTMAIVCWIFNLQKKKTKKKTPNLYQVDNKIID